MQFDIFKFIGTLGILLITIGIILRKRSLEDLFYALGGISLEIYSLHIHDLIFIVLQIIFTLTALYDFVRTLKTKKAVKN